MPGSLNPGKDGSVLLDKGLQLFPEWNSVWLQAFGGAYTVFLQGMPVWREVARFPARGQSCLFL